MMEYRAWFRHLLLSSFFLVIVVKKEASLISSLNETNGFVPQLFVFTLCLKMSTGKKVEMVFFFLSKMVIKT